MSAFQDDCVATYRNVASAPSVDSVFAARDRIQGDVLHWEANWSCRDLDRNSKVKFRTTGTVDTSGDKLTFTKNPCSTELKEEMMVQVSSCGKRRAVLREVSVKDKKHQFLEVWEGARKVSNTDLTEIDKHGTVHTNLVFGNFEWSHDGSKIAYVAEKKIPKTESFFKKSKDEEGKVKRGDEFLYRENWGEQLVECFQPTLFIFDVKSGEITDLSEHFSDGISVGDALWSADDKSLFILGWQASPWKLGLIYCRNRLSTLYKFDLECKQRIPLTDGKSCVYAPTFNPDCSSLIYLETIPFGPHGQCARMVCIDIDRNKPQEPRVLLDVVNKPASSDSFQGFFVDAIPRKCWLPNGHQLILHSMHRSNKALLCVDIKSGEVNLLEKSCVWTLLCVAGDVLFASHATPNQPPVFKAGIYHQNEINWITIDTPLPVQDDIKWSIQKHKPDLENNEYPGLDFETILIQPNGRQTSRGLIVNPHGGPHSTYLAGFDLYSAAYAKLGFTVARVNYRGSLGFGQGSVNSLPKHIGVQDVSDVQQVAASISKDFPPGKVFVEGGSHGGFLTLQLVGQHPDFYSAGATRNPVTNLLSQLCTTDIMDWCYHEAGMPFSYDSVINNEDSLKLLQCSPIVHISKVKAPLLFMIGSGDLRVPPSQSHEYIHGLRGLGKKVKVLKYDDNHPIAKVYSEADCFVNVCKWFSENSA